MAAYSQEYVNHKEVGSTYIKQFRNQLILKGYIQNKSNEFDITDRKNDVVSNYEPNGKSTFGIGFNYKSLGLSIGFLPMGKNNDVKYGKTRKFDIQGNLVTKKIGADLRLQYYQGFYLSNVSSLDPSYNTDSVYPIRSDIATLSLAAEVFYIFNHSKFSFKSIYTNNEWQKKSAGTFLVGLNYAIFSIGADSAIAPEVPNYKPDSSDYFSGASFFNLGIYGGYAYNLVIKKHGFLFVGAGPGIGAVRIRLYDNEGRHVSNRVLPAATFKFQFGGGLNSDKHFGGITYTNNSSGFNYNQGEGRFNFNSGTFKVYYGYRMF